MKKFIAGLAGLALFAGVPVFGQETHDQHRAQKPAAGEKGSKAANSNGMPCCEGMEKMGGMKDGMPMKVDMKAKMAEKMKMSSPDGSLQNSESKSQDKPSSEPGQHQH